MIYLGSSTWGEADLGVCLTYELLVDGVGVGFLFLLVSGVSSADFSLEGSS